MSVQTIVNRYDQGLSSSVILFVLSYGHCAVFVFYGRNLGMYILFHAYIRMIPKI